MRILLIEPDHGTAETTKLALRERGCSLFATDLGEEAVDLGKLYEYDAIALELDLPDMSGLDVIRRLRTAKVATPVVVVSGLCDVDTRIKALSLGADDFLPKPFHRDELMARLQAVVRRSKGHAQSIVTAGPLQVDLIGKTARVDGQAVHLTGKEFEILEMLALRKGVCVTKTSLFDRMYGDRPNEPEFKIIDVLVCKLRRKLAQAGADPRLIDTIWGRGYVLRDAPAGEAVAA